MARMPDLAARVLCFVTGYAVAMGMFHWWFRRWLGRWEAKENAEAIKLVETAARAQERVAHGQRFEGRVREWYAKWTPERWGMPDEAVRSLSAILEDRPPPPAP